MFLDFGSARISVENAHVFEEESLDLMCETNDTQHAQMYMYLCKDGVGISKRKVHSNEKIVFTVTQVKKGKSGHYSCVYSTKEYNHGDVRSTRNDNSINIQVKDIYSKIFLLFFVVNVGYLPWQIETGKISSGEFLREISGEISQRRILYFLINLILAFQISIIF